MQLNILMCIKEYPKFTGLIKKNKNKRITLLFIGNKKLVVGGYCDTYPSWISYA